MPVLHPDDRAAALLAPVIELVRQGVARLGGPDLAVSVGSVAGFYALEGERLVLSQALEGPELHHPDEYPLLPLDRWRRAAGSVLEAVAGRAHPIGASAPEWWRLGSAIDHADRALPELGLADPDLAWAIATGDLQRRPRGGVAAVRAARDLGVDLGALTAEQWLLIGRRVFEPSFAALPVPVERVRPVDIPVALGPWRWQPLEVPAHKRGGVVEIEGEAALEQAWAVAKRPLRTLAASVGSARLLAGVGGPLGRFAVRSAEGFGQVYGARGLVFDFRPSGALHLELADAFVGPLQAVGVAERMGTSGTTSGTWEIAGPRRLRFDRIVPQGLAVHGRTLRGPVLPATEFGMGPLLQAMQEDVWEWRLDEDRLLLRGRIMGGAVEVRLQRE